MDSKKYENVIEPARELSILWHFFHPNWWFLEVFEIIRPGGSLKIEDLHNTDVYLQILQILVEEEWSRNTCIQNNEHACQICG